MPTVMVLGLLVVGLIALAGTGLLAVYVVRQLAGGRGNARDAAVKAALDASREEANGIRVAALQLQADAEAEAERIKAKARAQAEAEASDIRRVAAQQAKDEAASIARRNTDADRREQRVSDREASADEHARSLDKRAKLLAEKESELARSAKKQQALQRELEEQAVRNDTERQLLLERAAGLTAEQAKRELVESIECEAKREAAFLVREIESEARLEGEKRAREIVTTAIQRVATEQTSESVVAVVHLPNDDMKGRIIGREGRNIKSFEHVTGVNLIIDDTPEVVQLSCFDPIRRETARHALEELIADGRIHPQRIEEAYERSVAEVELRCVRAGEDALVQTGLTDMHPELIRLLGASSFRTSYGQNVLAHVIESAHLAGLMAAELDMNPLMAKRCALLHDIGKALTHEVEGSHARVGAEVARRCGESPMVVNAIEAHHGEVEPTSVEAVLTQAADAISGGRPGARRESLEAYIRRLERIEEIARSRTGVEKVFAMQAGREVRVMVLPDVIDDIQAEVLARDIARQVQKELTYPGQIRITVVRESRATGIAA